MSPTRGLVGESEGCWHSLSNTSSFLMPSSLKSAARQAFVWCQTCFPLVLPCPGETEAAVMSCLPKASTASLHLCIASLPGSVHPDVTRVLEQAVVRRPFAHYVQAAGPQGCGALLHVLAEAPGSSCRPGHGSSVGSDRQPAA